MSAMADAFTFAMVGAGAVFFLAGTVGLLRFPDALTRLHALTKADTLGFGLIAIGLMPQCADIATAAKLFVIWVLVLVAGSAASQLIAQHVSRGPGGS
jgi:multicomponent Na+:H+ antiporter subunit G